ncbi:MAG: TraR/DksA C4-type zinc finger protein [Planctomycetota bacterium]|jgi:RNA polymerase-binding protein DksA|nr:TraR/DksA C4-type zinc finger protein [Planctomycetota bacterium]
MTKPKTKTTEKAAPEKTETPEKSAKTSKTAKAGAKPAAKKPASGKTATAAKAAAKGGKTAGRPKPSAGAAGKGDAAEKTPAGVKDSARVAQPVKKPEAENPPPPAPPIPMIGVKTSVDRPPSLSVTSLARKPVRQNSGQAEPAPRPPERKLSRKELADIKIILEEKREKLLSNMRREFAMQKERAESKAADDVDKATDAYDEDLSFEITTASDQGLEEIQAALEKIEKDTYGECEICGKPISPARLRILPSATVCVACRDQEEQASHRDDGPIPLFNIMTDEENGENEVEPL